MSEPEINNKYNNGKIYKIWNDINDDIYIGSTCQSLSKRMGHHREDSQKSQNMNRRVYQQMNDLGLSHFFIELIEYFPCSNREELNKREGHWIRAEKPILNTHIAGRTQTEYFNEHKEEILEYRKNYFEENKSKIAEQQRNYREANKATIREQKKTK